MFEDILRVLLQNDTKHKEKREGVSSVQDLSTKARGLVAVFQGDPRKGGLSGRRMPGACRSTARHECALGRPTHPASGKKKHSNHVVGGFHVEL